MADDFYKAFEDKFRGSADDIKQRLTVYLPYLHALKLTGITQFDCLDIGCGRGEWLELLSDEGFHPRGVDLNEAMVRHCQSKGLKVEHKDALATLKETPPNSLCIVSGFHIAEHLPFDTLREIFREAHRVLIPCGLLIFETPNPENITVGSNYFYLDPTHVKPIPLQLLSFVAEFQGFNPVKAIRLNAPSTGNKGLLTVFTNVSPDYAIIGQKHTGSAQSQLFDELFSVEVGTSLGFAAQEYDRNTETLKREIISYSKRIDHLELRLTKLTTTMSRVENTIDRFTALKQLGPRKSMVKIAKIFVKKTVSVTKAFLGGVPLLKNVIKAILPKGITFKIKEKVFTDHDKPAIGKPQLSSYANEFYNSLKSARAQK
jgi:SAM-dependent methyltransferase